MKSVKSAPAAWDSQLASETAEKAYRYVADVYPSGVSYEPLGPHTNAAYRAERRGDMEAFTAALRALCRTARDEARLTKKGAA